MPAATVSAKGWVVIPAALRRKYGLKPGTRVQIVDYGGGLSILPEMADPVAESFGMLEGGPSLTQDLLEERAREREREERKIERLGSG